jgi:hypothetical protein
VLSLEWRNWQTRRTQNPGDRKRRNGPSAYQQDINSVLDE